MLVDVNDLARHRAAIRNHDDRWFIWGEFERLWLSCHLGRAMGRADLSDLYQHITAVHTRVRDLRTIAFKLDWMRQLRGAEQLPQEWWMYFAASDVVSFLTNVRSLFDHLAGAMADVANTPGRVAHRSFHGLLKWLSSSSERRQELNPALADIVQSAAEWFWQVRRLRDRLIHHDALPLVFPGESFPGSPAIGVQVYEGLDHLLPSDSSLMLNDNVVDFRRLAAAVTARIHVLLEETAIVMRGGVNSDISASGGESYHPGLGTLADWTDELLSDLV